MKPRREISSSADKLLTDLIRSIEAFDCNKYFPRHLGLPQSEQKSIVSHFQDDLLTHLQDRHGGFVWKKEHWPAAEHGDSIDICGNSADGLLVALELDKPRADQVAKKFVSRMALLASSGKKIHYLALCYPGTRKMNVNECIKYFRYCNTIAHLLTHQYASFIIA